MMFGRSSRRVRLPEALLVVAYGTAWGGCRCCATGARFGIDANSLISWGWSVGYGYAPNQNTGLLQMSTDIGDDLVS
jgi:hypothetical protein